MQRVTAVGGIEQDQCQVGVVEKQRMGQPVVGLACQVPENGFTLGAIGTACAQFIEHPELLAVCRSMFLKLAMRQSPAESRLAHARIAHQDDFGGSMMHRSGRSSGLWRFAEKDSKIELPDVDERVAFLFWCVRIRAN
jgi:hypothetical protein